MKHSRSAGFRALACELLKAPIPEMRIHAGRFRRLLHAVLFTAPAALAATATACSSSNATQMPERATCIDIKATSRYASLTLGKSADGVALGTRTQSFATDGTSNLVNGPLEKLASLGTPCSTATDQAACLAKVDDLLEKSAGWQVNDPFCFDCGSANNRIDIAVATNGNDVRAITLAELGTASLPIESREEAAALLMLNGRGLDCGDSNARPEADGWTFKQTRSSCSGAVWEQFWWVKSTDASINDGGQNQVEEEDNGCIEGRRPAELLATADSASWLSSLGSCFAEIAHMEAAAVIAFADLERELAMHDAPIELRERAAKAKADEINHAKITRALALRFGKTPQTPTAASTKPNATLREKSLLEIALENAAEGCVREAFGALVAAYQATHAADEEIRSAFASIALEEADHADFSLALDAWLSLWLSPDERALVNQAKRKAWTELCRTASALEPAEEVVRVAGMPTARAARVLLASLSLTASEEAA